MSLSQGSDTTAGGLNAHAIELSYSILIAPVPATFTLDGVPAGTQADVEKALNSFYIQG